MEPARLSATVIRLFGFLALAAVLPSLPSYGADTAAGPARLGIVLTISPSTLPPAFADFWLRLRELGWVRGENLYVEERWAEGRIERLPALIDDVLRLKVDVVLTGTEAGAAAARLATHSTPIVAITMGDRSEEHTSELQSR